MYNNTLTYICQILFIFLLILSLLFSDTICCLFCLKKEHIKVQTNTDKETHKTIQANSSEKHSKQIPRDSQNLCKNECNKTTFFQKNRISNYIRFTKYFDFRLVLIYNNKYR